MSAYRTFTVAGTTPAAAGRAVIGQAVGGLDLYERIGVVAELVGATGGALDIYIQSKIGDDKWVDVAHYPQLSSAAAAVKYAHQLAQSSPIAVTPTVVGVSADDVTAGAAPVLAANTVLPGHVGQQLRVVAVAGASTSAGAAITIHFRCAPSAGS